MTPDQKAILALTADNERLRGLLREAADDKLLSVAIELGTTKARLAEAEALIHEAVELLRMWVIRDSMADDAKSPHQKTDTFLLLRRRK